jgi:hypothetical protein
MKMVLRRILVLWWVVGGRERREEGRGSGERTGADGGGKVVPDETSFSPIETSMRLLLALYLTLRVKSFPPRHQRLRPP